MKKPDASAEFIERANALDKGNLGGRVRLAEVRLAKGETDVGMRDLETLATEDPDRREPDIALKDTKMIGATITPIIAMRRVPKASARRPAIGSVTIARKAVTPISARSERDQPKAVMRCGVKTLVM